MSARNFTKEYNHFLVRFGDSEYHVVQRCKITTDGRVKVGETYNTIWGVNDSDNDQAVVVTTGEWIDMRQTVTKQL